MPEEPARLDETVDAKPYVPPKPGRSLTGFYVALGVVVAMGLFGGWFWKTWNVWWFDADEARRRQAQAAAKLGMPVEKVVDLGGGVKLELVLVPAGRFRMGSPAEEKDRKKDETQHWVVITKPFYLGKYEVTQEQWEKVMGNNPSNFKGTRNPVENVSWDDSQDFLKKLNTQCKERGQFRLPTEAEWEWACRAGTRTRFCFGDDDGALLDYAWIEANTIEANTGDSYGNPVGAKKPNAWGLFDMHGNVWEWCGDWYGEDYYAKSPRFDPTGPATGLFRVSRGGAWFMGLKAGDFRSSIRESMFPNGRSNTFGFRVVLVPAVP